MTTERSKFTEAELALLTDEEREGLLDDDADEGEGEGDGTDEGEDTTAEDGGSDDKDGGDTDGADDGEGDGQDDADAAKLAADATATAAAAAEAPAADQGTGAGPEAAGADQTGQDASDEANEKRPAWLDAEDLTTKKAELKQQLAELAKKFDDGDLMATEFNEQREAIEDQREELLKREIRIETQRETALETWRDEVKNFTKDHPQYKKGGFLYDALDKTVRELQVTAVNPLSPAILAKAHKAIQAELGLPIEDKQAPAPAPKPTVRSDKARPAPPPTLAHIPASDITDADDGGEFAHLDRLMDKDSVAYEAALKRLSPADQDRYLSQS
jgi:hypothetical protein